MYKNNLFNDLLTTTAFTNFYFEISYRVFYSLDYLRSTYLLCVQTL